MKDFLTGLLAKIVDKPEALTVAEDEDVYDLTLTITANPDDYGRIIGKKGRTINALRTLLCLYLHKKTLSQTRRKKIVLRVDSQSEPNGLSLVS